MKKTVGIFNVWISFSEFLLSGLGYYNLITGHEDFDKTSFFIFYFATIMSSLHYLEKEEKYTSWVTFLNVVALLLSTAGLFISRINACPQTLLGIFASFYPIKMAAEALFILCKYIGKR